MAFTIPDRNQWFTIPLDESRHNDRTDLLSFITSTNISQVFTLHPYQQSVFNTLSQTPQNSMQREFQPLPDHPVMGLHPFDPQFLAFIKQTYPTAKVGSGNTSIYTASTEVQAMVNELNRAFPENLLPVTESRSNHRILGLGNHLIKEGIGEVALDLYPHCNSRLDYEDYRNRSAELVTAEALRTYQLLKSRTEIRNWDGRHTNYLKFRKINQFEFPGDEGLVMSFAVSTKSYSGNPFINNTFIINVWYVKEFMFNQSIHSRSYRGPTPYEAQGLPYEIWRHVFAYHGIELQPSGLLQFKFHTVDGRFSATPTKAECEHLMNAIYLSLNNTNTATTKRQLYDSITANDFVSSDMFGIEHFGGRYRVTPGRVISPEFRRANPGLCDFIDDMSRRINDTWWRNTTVEMANKAVARERITKSVLDSRYLDKWAKSLKNIVSRDAIKSEWKEQVPEKLTAMTLEQLNYRSRLGALIASQI